jgi:exodeoxyribonuclease VII small subunit
MSKKAQSFEKSMESLEEIVSDMEAGKLSLDAMIERFEEGQKLIKFCTGKLDEVERKIEKLLNIEGEPQTEPFGDEAEPSSKPAAAEPAKEHAPIDDGMGELPF